MSSRVLADDQSVGSDDTPATSNVGFELSHSFEVALNEEELVPYGRQLQTDEHTSAELVVEEAASLRHSDQDLDDERLSIGLHGGRITQYRVDEDSDDTSRDLTQHDGSQLLSLTAIPASDELVYQSQTISLDEPQLLAADSSENEELTHESAALFQAPVPEVEESFKDDHPDEPGVDLPTQAFLSVPVSAIPEVDESVKDNHPDEKVIDLPTQVSDALVPVSIPSTLETATCHDDDQPGEGSDSNLSPHSLSVDLVLHQSQDLPQETAVIPYAQSPSDIVPVEYAHQIVPKEQTLCVSSDLGEESARQIVPRESNLTASSDLVAESEEKIDEETSQPAAEFDEDFSISPSEVFGGRSVSRPPVAAPSTSWVKDDDDSTINTHGDSYWTAKPDLAKASYPTQPSTIEEGNEDEDEESATLGASKRSQGSFTNGSQQSRSSASVRSTGVVLRTGSSRRKDDFREVEVSMDGFMHQNRHLDDHAINVHPLVGATLEGKKIKLSKVFKYSTLCAALFLLATIIFFAVNIGPFEIQPETQAVSSHLNMNPNEKVSPPTADSTQGATTASAPTWMLNIFANWERPCVGKSVEIPVVWTLEKSGGDIFVDAVSRCLGKVVAGDGLRYDVQNAHGKHFESKAFKVLNTDGELYLNVDLFSLSGINRAARLKLTQNRVSDLIVTPFLMDASSKLFPPKSSIDAFPEVAGRLLVIFRDPIERSLNRYETTRIMTGNDSLTLTEYVTNAVYSENNPLTRGLLGLGPHDMIGDVQLKSAEVSIRQFVLVGLFEAIEESIERYETFFQWIVGGGMAPQNTECHEDIQQAHERGYKIGSKYADSDPSGYNLLLASHTIDLQLYKFAKAQYESQGQSLRSS